MSQEQAEWAIQSLYENVSARDELTDEEAETLLKWGEEQIIRLADQELDEAQFEMAFDTLSGLVRRMNRLAARWSNMQSEDQEIAMNRIAEEANQIGLSIPPESLTLYFSQSANPNIHDNVRALISMVMSGQQ